MSCVHYKFSSTLKYDLVTFEGLHISLCDLKKRIMGREKLKATRCDLQITNAQTMEEYTDDNALIPKNISVIVRRIPISGVKSTSNQNFQSGPRIKKSTGIPRSFMMEVKDPNMKGALLTKTGKYAIPTIVAEAYAIGKKEKPPFLPEEPPSPSEEDDPIPDELLCLICKDIMTDAAIIPCCGNSYCDECIRTALLESDEHTCPTCHEDDVSPDALIANKCLRLAVNNFKNETGYTRRLRKQLPPPPPPGPPPRPLIHRNLQPLTRSPISRQQETSSSSGEDDLIPEELLCLLCKDMMTDAVVIPCCGNSYCDECIRTALLESDEHTCPTCHEDDVSPDALVANKCLRQAVNNFENETGYTRRLRQLLPPPPPPGPPPRPLIHRNLRPLKRSPISRQQDPLMIPVTSSSTHSAPSLSSLTSDQSSLAPPMPGNACNPAPVPDITASVSISVHSEKPDGPFRDADKKMLPAAALVSDHPKGTSSIAVTALMEEKGYQVPVLGAPSLLGQSLLHGQLIATTGPARINAARPGGGRPGWEHSNKLGYLVSPPQQIRRGERSCYRSINHGRHHGERSQRTQGPSLPATPVFVPVPPPPLYPPPPHTLPLPLGVPPPQFTPPFPPGQPPPAGYSGPPPGFPPAPANLSTSWVSSGVQTAHSNTIPTTQAPPLSRGEFYREQPRLKEESQSPYSGSSYSRSPYTCSKSRSGSRRSPFYSRALSRSPSRSYSRSPPYARRGRGKSRNYHSRPRSQRYHRSRSRSPPSRRYHSRSRSPQAFRGQSPNKRHGPQGERERGYFNRFREVPPPYDRKAYCGRSVDFRDPFEKEPYRDWERKRSEWYEKL